MFKLSATLAGHSQDVRAVCTTPWGHILTGSRDTTARLWAANEAAGAYECIAVLTGHTHFVGAACHVPAHGPFEHGLLATGGHDKLVMTYNLDDPTVVVHTLVGHTEPVCALAAADNGVLISGSWDRTARVWADGHCVAVLTGHEQSVWAVLVIENGRYVTGSADKSIRLWEGVQCVRVLTGHADCVRGLALVPHVGFVSCGNDSSVKLWSATGDMLVEFNGHSSFVYACAAISSTTFLSSGEDRTVRIWTADGQCRQAIHHPATSVWAVAALPNGDFVSGTSDGMARVFSATQDRQADADSLQAFEDEVGKFSVHSESVGSINKKDLPGVEALQSPGTRDQQVRMIRQGRLVEAYQWSASEGRWVKVGEVVDAVGSGRQVLEGKEYDHVFDVDLGDGLPTRKLGYNNTENPWVVAQDFIHREELPQHFLDQVANFIVTNAKPVMLEAVDDTTQSQFADPFTGAHSYVPGSGSAAPRLPTNANSPNALSCFIFDTASAALLGKKVAQFSDSLRGDQQLSAEEMRALETASPHIETGDKARRFNFTAQHIALADKMLGWPADMVFPGIDILRMIVLNPRQASLVATPARTREVLTVSRLGMEGSHDAACMLALRFFANALSVEASAPVVLAVAGEVISRLHKSGNVATKNTRVATASFLANLFIRGGTSAGAWQQGALALLLQGFATETEPDVLLRTLCGLTALVSKQRSRASDIAASGALPHIQRLLDSPSDPVRKMAAQLGELLLAAGKHA